MRFGATILAGLMLLCAAPAAAQVAARVSNGEWIDTGSAARFISPQVVEAESRSIASYGPFRVLDAETFALVDITDERSPAQFAAMIAVHPGLAVMRIVEAPGTFDDRANLLLGRKIRAAGIAVHVPDGGSVRSGAVELVLAGTALRVDDGAEFAVHAWLDEDGRQASDYPADSPEHRKYLSYYREMGMDEQRAAAFYAMTNSVPFEQAHWLTGTEMRQWIGGQQHSAPRLAYLDLARALN